MKLLQFSAACYYFLTLGSKARQVASRVVELNCVVYSYVDLIYAQLKKMVVAAAVTHQGTCLEELRKITQTQCHDRG
jgi:hypothetical protein